MFIDRTFQQQSFLSSVSLSEDKQDLLPVTIEKIREIETGVYPNERLKRYYNLNVSLRMALINILWQPKNQIPLGFAL